MFDFIKQNPLLWLIIFLLIVSPSFLFGAFQVLAVIVGVVILLIIIGLLVLRWKIYSLQKQSNGEGSMGGQGFGGEYFRTTRDTTQTGDVDVKIINPNSEKRVSKDVGDYVDFEEVEEEK